MNPRSLSICYLIGLFVSCNNQTREPGDSAQKSQADTIQQSQASVVNCYRYSNKNDTITLKTLNVNGNITGTLVYSIYQKDRNQGTIQGRMNDELLVADYTFMSEGMESVRQVAFKKVGNDFIEGYGDVEDRNGKFSFKNIDSLSFNNSMLLARVNCE